MKEKKKKQLLVRDWAQIPAMQEDSLPPESLEKAKVEHYSGLLQRVGHY